MGENNNSENIYYDNQDINADITPIYKAFISEIDDVRSLFGNYSALTSFSDKNIDQVRAASSAELAEPQESRCSAFYRLLGLPVVSPDGQLYNPGFSKEINTSAEKRANQYSIASALLKDNTIKKILNEREASSKAKNQVFSRGGINAIALALAVRYIRPVSLLKKGDSQPLSDIEPQTFDIKERDKLIDVLFDPAEDISEILSTGTHILKPFIVDPRIDFTIYPAANRIAAPFLTDANRKLRDGFLFKKPFIEKVCRVRFNVRNSDADLGQYLKDLLENAKKDAKITDQSLINLTNNASKFFRSDAFIFINMVKTIRVVVDVLAKSLKKIDEVSSKMNYVPVPSEKGIEGGLTLRDIVKEDPNNTEEERRLAELALHKTIADIEVEQFEQKVLNNSFALSSIDSVAFGSAVKNIPRVYEKRIAKITNNRDSLGKSANAALYNVAIIFGDYTGLGLLDILTIYTALWVMDKKALLTFLDNDAFARMYELPELRSKEVEDRHSNGSSGVKPLEALTNFENTVKRIQDFIQLLIDIKLGGTKRA